jgi:hypothetical protein
MARQESAGFRRSLPESLPKGRRNTDPDPGYGRPVRNPAVLEAQLYRGELTRRDAATIVGTGERQARSVASALTDHGVSPPKAPAPL